MDRQIEKQTHIKNVIFGNAPHHYNGAKNSDTKQYSFLVYEYRNRKQKWGDDRGDSPDAVVSRWIVSASATVVFPCTIKSRRWRAVTEEVDKGCRELCVTVGTVTRTASILIHSRLQALAVS